MSFVTVGAVVGFLVCGGLNDEQKSTEGVWRVSRCSRIRGCFAESWSIG